MKDKSRSRLSVQGGTLFPEKLHPKGIYTLVFLLKKEERVTVGKLGSKVFPPGYYSYTGSATGNGATSLPNRLSRHFRKGKKKHWHIDYLLASESAQIVSVAATGLQPRSECQVNQFLQTCIPEARSLVPKFGATDCRTRCGSHLLYFGNRNVEKEIRRMYQQRFDQPAVFLHGRESLDA
jgi:Uri superfamily endonuclease